MNNVITATIHDLDSFSIEEMLHFVHYCVTSNHHDEFCFYPKKKIPSGIYKKLRRGGGHFKYRVCMKRGKYRIGNVSYIFLKEESCYGHIISYLNSYLALLRFAFFLPVPGSTKLLHVPLFGETKVCLVDCKPAGVEPLPPPNTRSCVYAVLRQNSPIQFFIDYHHDCIISLYSIHVFWDDGAFQFIFILHSHNNTW